MINCNPETMSTDYDTSDRLYFEPLTDEDVISILAREAQNGDLRGVIVQLGGQTPLKIAAALEGEGIPFSAPILMRLTLPGKERFGFCSKSLTFCSLKMVLPIRQKRPAKLSKESAYLLLSAHRMC